MNMDKIFTVFYRKAPNQNITHYQSETRCIGSRTVYGLAEAKKFASTVDVKSIISGTGKRIKL